MLDFKRDFDEKVHGVGDLDGMGHHYARFEDYAIEANELYDLGIDIEKVREAAKEWIFRRSRRGKERSLRRIKERSQPPAGARYAAKKGKERERIENF